MRWNFIIIWLLPIIRLEKPDSVISICKRALEHTTADSKKEIVSDFYSILGDMYHTQKQMKEAYAAYDSALVYNPSNIGALNNYAYYLSVERRVWIKRKK